MGFDVSSLEVLLETDFPQFKKKRFELLRSQILAGTPAGHSTVHQPAQHTREGGKAAPAHPKPARPSLFSHFSPYHGRSVPSAAAPAGPAIQAEPAAGPPVREQMHSEMRYPATRRRHEKLVRTYSVSAEQPHRNVGIIDLGGSPARKAIPAGRQAPLAKKPAGAPRRPDGISRVFPTSPDRSEDTGKALKRWLASEDIEEARLERPTEGSVANTAIDEADILEQPAAEGEENVEEETGSDEDETSTAVPDGDISSELPVEDSDLDIAGEKEPEEVYGIDEELPDEGRQRAVVKKRKVQRKAGPPKNRGWIAASVVVMLVLAGLGAWYFISAPAERLAAKGWHPATAIAGEDVMFDAANSSSSGPAIVNYSWDFGDGGRENLKRAAHHYIAAGTYNVVLTVRNDKGDRASQRSTITITPLAMTVLAMMVGDTGNYDVTGDAVVSNTNSYLYTYKLGVGTIQVSQIEMNFFGTSSQWAREVVSREDGFKNIHNCLHIDTSENLDLSGNATTNSGKYPINGAIDYDEASYADPASGGVFVSEPRARTSLSLSGLSFASANSSDTMRTYPSVAGVLGQFQLEKIYRGHRFDQSDSSTLNGNLTGGGINYSWMATGVDNAGGLPSVGIHVTGDPAALRSNGITEFYIDIFVSGKSSMPTRTHIHVAGLNGDTSYISDHSTEMTGFTPGTTTIDRTPQLFNPDPLPAGMFAAPFDNVPEAGSGPTSLKFTPEEAVSEAASRNADFAQFLLATPLAYAVSGKYYEGPVPETSDWNLTFSYPGATTGRYINVTRDLLHQYGVTSEWETATKVTTSEGNLSRLLTISSAHAIFLNDSATASNFFSGGAIQFSGGASLSFEADATYPAINLASMSASAQTSRYAAILQKGAYTSAISMDTGQMMYFWTHTVS
jgi:PKD repeat protein